MKLRPLLLVTFMISIILGIKAQNSSNPFVFPLIDGVIVDLENSRIFIINSKDQLEEITINSGTNVWNGGNNYLPLLLFNEKLLCRDLNNSNKQNIRLVEYDLLRNNRTPTPLTLNMPRGLVAKATSSPGEFLLSSTIDKTFSTIFWSYKHTYKDGTGATKPNGTNYSGAIELNHASGQQFEIKESIAQKRSSMYMLNVAPRNKIMGVEGKQYYSRDKQHILVSVRGGTSNPLLLYRWRIYNADSKQLLGEHRTFNSYAPFFVSDGVLKYVKPQHTYIENGSLVDSPMCLRAFSLSSNTILWERMFRSPIYLGPNPS